MSDSDSSNGYKNGNGVTLTWRNIVGVVTFFLVIVFGLAGSVCGLLYVQTQARMDRIENNLESDLEAVESRVKEDIDEIKEKYEQALRDFDERMQREMRDLDRILEVQLAGIVSLVNERAGVNQEAIVKLRSDIVRLWEELRIVASDIRRIVERLSKAEAQIEQIEQGQ